jgi:hypothetical protein
LTHPNLIQHIYSILKPSEASGELPGFSVFSTSQAANLLPKGPQWEAAPLSLDVASHLAANWNITILGKSTNFFLGHVQVRKL